MRGCSCIPKENIFKHAKVGRNMRYGFLIEQLAWTDFKLRYNASVLGYFWSLLNPLLQFGVLFLVFSIFMRFDVPNYGLYLLLGIIFWQFLSEATNNAMISLLNKALLIKKMNFPREIIVFASNLTTSIGFFLNLVVFVVFLIFAGIGFSWSIIFFPLYLMILLAIISGLSFLLSALYIRFRDIQHIWTVLLQLGFWLTPIAYPATLVPDKFRVLFNLNPFYAIIDNSREILIYGKMPDTVSTIISILLAGLIFFIGYFTFKKMSGSFAEYI